MALIEFKNVHFSYPILDNVRALKSSLLKKAKINCGSIFKDSEIPYVKVLNGISFKISNGDRIGLLGSNGCGKSTLLRIMANIFYPDNGEINIDGKSTTLFDLVSGMNIDSTGIENIFMRGFMLGKKRKEIENKIDEIVEFSELGEFIYLPVSTYSQGMYARLGFSISTAFKPEILLIDEGIGTGDKDFQIKASNRIKQLTKSANILVFASHSDDLLKLYCNKIFKIDNGLISEIINL